MRMRVLVPALALLLCVPAAAQTRVDPKMNSIYPFSGQRGTTYTATVRGNGLAGAVTAVTESAPFTVAVEKVATEPAPDTGRNRTPTDLVTLRIEVTGDAKPGRYPIRLVTRHGITNALPV